MTAAGPFFGPLNLTAGSTSVNMGFDRSNADNLTIALYNSSFPSNPRLTLSLSGNGTSLSSYTWITADGVSTMNFNYEMPESYFTPYIVICNNVLRFLAGSPTGKPILTIMNDLLSSFNTVYATGTGGGIITLNTNSVQLPCCCNYTLPSALAATSTSTSTATVTKNKYPLWMLILFSATALALGTTLGGSVILLLKKRSKKQV